MDGDFFGSIGDTFSNLFGGGSQTPDLQSFTDNPAGTPGLSTYGGTAPSSGSLFDLTNSFGFNPIASSAPSSGNSFTQPNNLGGVAAPGFSSISTGSYGTPSAATSAGSDPLAALFAGQNQPNQQVGPTNFSAPPAGGGSAPPAQDNSLLSLLGLGTGNGKTDSTLLGAGVSGAGLLYNLMSGSPSASAEKQLKNIAGQQSSQGQQLESYIANGTLPPGAQTWVNQQTAGQKAAIRSKYAQLGMTGSTAETQELNNVDAQATSQMFTIASQLLNTGVTETGASANLYQALMNAQNADAKDVSSAIQNFVTSLGGGGSPRSISLNLPGAA